MYHFKELIGLPGGSFEGNRMCYYCQSFERHFIACTLSLRALHRVKHRWKEAKDEKTGGGIGLQRQASKEVKRYFRISRVVMCVSRPWDLDYRSWKNGIFLQRTF